MMTLKQEELANSFLSKLDEQTKPLYYEIISHLSSLGYNPKKEKNNLSFKHTLHNKQMAKMSSRNNLPVFALRFSACRGYSQRFDDIVKAFIVKYPTRSSRCTSDSCNYCGGAAETHVYTAIFSSSETRTHCGAYALEIPDLRPNDIGEIKKLIQQEHAYLLEHEAGSSNPSPRSHN
ncbi:MAG: hypothetical protein ACRC3H_21910 [Lachnospiraceae bacterium]